MRIKWKCLIGSVGGTLFLWAVVTAIGYYAFWLGTGPIPPLLICGLMGLAMVVVTALPTCALYDMCKDKWH